MNAEKQKVTELLRKYVSYSDELLDKATSEILAIFHPPQRNHNTLEVNELTPEGTLLQVRDSEETKWRLRYLSHVTDGKAYCYDNGFNKANGRCFWRYARIYIGQHFIPWDAEQSKGAPPCEGRVAVFTENYGCSQGYSKSYDWSSNADTTNIIGYLPITSTSEIDWERVPG